MASNAATLNDAIQSLQQAINQNPSNLNPRLQLMQLLDQARQFQPCEQVALSILELAPDNLVASRQLVRCKLEVGDYANAIKVAEKLLRKSPGDMLAELFLGQALCHSGKVKRGASILAKLCANSDHGLLAALPVLAGFARKAKLDIAPYIAKVEPLLSADAPAAQRTPMTIMFFAIGRYLSDMGDHIGSVKWLKVANLLFRSGFEYDHQQAKAQFEQIKTEFDATCFEESPESELGKGLVFILGMPRSGTSLVEQILSSHSKVKGCGELGLVANLINVLGSDIKPASFGERYVAAIRDTFGDTPVLTDKMPDNFKHIGLIAKALPGAKIVHCKRSPIETCVSIFKQQFKGEHFYAYDQEELANYYLLYEELMAHWKTVLPERIFEIEYETLVANQEQETRRLLAHCELDFENNCLAFHKQKRAVATSSSAQVREKIYKRSVSVVDKYGDFFLPLQSALEKG